MHFWSIWEMLRLYSCMLITVNALDRRLMRRASTTSSGRVPSIRNRRNGFAQAGPSSAVGSDCLPVGVIGWTRIYHLCWLTGVVVVYGCLECCRLCFDGSLAD